MALPLSRNTTYAVGSEVKSADLNDIQDKIVDAYGKYWTRTSLTDNSPVAATTDRVGRERHYLDPNGYWMGPAIQETHRWTGINNGTDKGSGVIVSAGRATTNTPGAGADPTISIDSGSNVPLAYRMGAPVAVTTVQSTSAGSWATIQQDAGAGSAAAPEAPISELDEVVAVFETIAGVDSASLSGARFFLGFHNSAYWYSPLGNAIRDDSIDNIYAMFSASSLGANWKCDLWDNSAAFGSINNDSGVPIVAGNLHTFRVEVHGSNTPVGVTAGISPVARFFIDGVLVFESSVNVPQSAYGGALGFLIAGEADPVGPATDKKLYTGPVKVAWNAVLTPFVPA